MKKLFILLTVISISLTSCENRDDLPSVNSDVKWWILVHPTNGNPGLYLYNETTSTTELKLNLPDKLSSPQALGYDGKSLWVGGMGDNESIFELDPKDGMVVSEIKNHRTVGIACYNGYLYYAIYAEIFKINKKGDPIENFNIKSANIIEDIFIHKSDLYFAFNAENDPIMKYNSITKEEDLIVNTQVKALYTLAIFNNNLIVVTDNNEFRRFDIETGSYISDKKIHIDGWITAIAPYSSN